MKPIIQQLITWYETPFIRCPILICWCCQACGSIRSWRSKIGSNALTIVDGIFQAKEPSEVLEEIKGYLPPPRFLCKQPNAVVGVYFDQWCLC
jgi:hypothetical protein